MDFASAMLVDASTSRGVRGLHGERLSQHPLAGPSRK